MKKTLMIAALIAMSGMAVAAAPATPSLVPGAYDHARGGFGDTSPRHSGWTAAVPAPVPGAYDHERGGFGDKSPRHSGF